MFQRDALDLEVTPHHFHHVLLISKVGDSP